VLANEVLDNFPVHILEVTKAGSVQEVYVDIDADGFVERLGALSDTTLAAPARRGPRRGGREINRGLNYRTLRPRKTQMIRRKLW
jgi:hypothetical protein